MIRSFFEKIKLAFEEEYICARARRIHIIHKTVRPVILLQTEMLNQHRMYKYTFVHVFCTHCNARERIPGSRRTTQVHVKELLTYSNEAIVRDDWEAVGRDRKIC